MEVYRRHITQRQVRAFEHNVEEIRALFGDDAVEEILRRMNSMLATIGDGKIDMTFVAREMIVDYALTTIDAALERAMRYAAQDDTMHVRHFWRACGELGFLVAPDDDDDLCLVRPTIPEDEGAFQQLR